MSKYVRQLLASTEAVDETLPPPPAAATIPVDPAALPPDPVDTAPAGVPLDDTAEQDVTGVVESGAEIVTDTEAVGEVVDAVATLESIRGSIEKYLVSGQYTPALGASLVSRANGVCASVGLTPVKDAGVSIESIDDPYRHATVAYESIGEKIKNAGKAIWKSISRICQKIANYFLGTFTSAKGLEKRAEALKASAQNATADSTETIQIGRYVGYLDTLVKHRPVEPVRSINDTAKVVVEASDEFERLIHAIVAKRGNYAANAAAEEGYRKKAEELDAKYQLSSLQKNAPEELEIAAFKRSDIIKVCDAVIKYAKFMQESKVAAVLERLKKIADEEDKKPDSDGAEGDGAKKDRSFGEIVLLNIIARAIVRSNGVFFKVMLAGLKMGEMSVVVEKKD